MPQREETTMIEEPDELGDTRHAKEAEREARFRPTLLKVLLVQVVALILLWLLQTTYHS